MMLIEEDQISRIKSIIPDKLNKVVLKNELSPVVNVVKYGRSN